MAGVSPSTWLLSNYVVLLRKMAVGVFELLSNYEVIMTSGIKVFFKNHACELHMIAVNFW